MISSKSGFHISVPSMVGICSNQYKWSNLYFQSIGPLGRCFHRVAMSVGPLLCYFFRGLSLALRSQDQFKASDWRRRRRRGGGNFFIYIFFFGRKSPLAAAATMAAGRDKKMLKSLLAAELLSASVERCFVSRMRDFKKWLQYF